MEELKGIYPPDGGWEECCYYEVEVKVRPGNAVHRSIFYSGFLSDEKQPRGYNQLWHPTYSRRISYGEVYYMRVLQKLPIGETIEVSQRRLDHADHLDW